MEVSERSIRDKRSERSEMFRKEPKMMKKRILIPALVLALTLALSACGDDEPVETTGDSATDSAP